MTLYALSVLAILAFSGFVQGFVGIGFAMIATPLLALRMDYSSAVVISAVPLWIISGVTLWMWRRHLAALSWARIMAVSVIVGSALGVFIQINLPQRLSMILLAALLLFGALIPVAVRKYRETHLRVGIEHAPASSSRCSTLARRSWCFTAGWRSWGGSSF